MLSLFGNILHLGIRFPIKTSSDDFLIISKFHSTFQRRSNCHGKMYIPRVIVSNYTN